MKLILQPELFFKVLLRPEWILQFYKHFLIVLYFLTHSQIGIAHLFFGPRFTKVISNYRFLESLYKA